ncbi:stalk domain-containing protein [Cytobacillus gottheilii]|uniref:stalk domain-containing protein n=1 Tax=Cytobacillus gottheilii TaxID=859144 RepID=UPI0015937574|nr:stalk domain-containing protein [Cytobacillus gottheilii]
MWRAFLLIIIILSASISGMLFWQWEAFSEQKDPDSSETSNITQSISIYTASNELSVHQKVSGLAEGVIYEAALPQQLFNFKCVDTNGNPCIAESEEPYFYSSEDGQLHFSYTIPVEDRGNSFLLDHWTVGLVDTSISKTHIEVTESVNRDGTWMAGLPLQGYKEKEYIDYFSFEGSGDVSPLYWQASPLTYYETDTGFNYYAEQPVLESSSFEAISELNDFHNLSIVITDQHQPYESGSLMIENKEITEKALEHKLLIHYYHNKFASLELAEDWLADVFVAQTLGNEAHTQKGKAILSDMNEKLSEFELDLFFSSIHNEPHELTAEKLDSALTKIMELRTSFYTLNSQSDDFIPLFYYDDRTLIVQGEEKENNVIYEGARSLFPLKETLEYFGYHVQYLPEQETVLIQNKDKSYRFYLNKNIFILNEDNYGLLQNPLTMMYGSIYMEKQWLDSIFNLQIEENSSEISISVNQ